MRELSELVEEYQESCPPKWLEEAEEWDLDEESLEPIKFDDSVEKWFLDLADYLDKLSQQTKRSIYKSLSDRVRIGINEFKGKTKEEAVDHIVLLYGGKANDLIDDRNHLVWSRATLCSHLARWADMIDALPKYLLN